MRCTSAVCTKALFEMFPDLSDQTLSSVWRNCGGDFSAAVDEALTISSLDDFNVEGELKVVESLFRPMQPGGTHSAERRAPRAAPYL